MEELTRSGRIFFTRMARIILFFIAFGAFCIGAYQGWWHASRAALAVAAGVMAVVLVGKLVRVIRRIRPGKSSISVKTAFALALAVGFGVFIWVSVAIGFYNAYKYAMAPELARVTSLALVAIITLAAGIVLFFVRLKWRCVYGLSEALIGVVVASQRYYTDALVNPTTTTSLALAVLTAGVYLVVRGADNIHHGLTKAPIDPIGQRFILWVNTWAAKGNKPEVPAGTATVDGADALGQTRSETIK